MAEKKPFKKRSALAKLVLTERRYRLQKGILLPEDRKAVPPSENSAKLNTHRAMVTARHLGADERAFETRAQSGAEEEVVNAPADVPGAGVAHLTPPGVMPAAFLKLTETCR